MPLVMTDAVVLHAFDYLESSRIIRLATRDAGLQSVLARGARSSSRRFGLGLDLFASGVAQIQLRPGRELQQLDGFDLTSSRDPIARDLERFAAASALAELALRFADGDEPGDLYATLIAALDAVAAAPGDRARDVGLAAAWHLVAGFGFAPVLTRCCRCELLLADEDTATFSHGAGGCACRACAPLLPRGRPLPPEARAALRAWTTGTVGTDWPVIETAMRRAHLRLLREFLEQHLNDGRPLRAFETWERGLGTLGAALG
ncbi:MAG: DNA repair protein RecO [Gemmatimonadaceae bacterium]|nr:DNA repair protein RecO [Gemmatimonadaceae bacterium]